MLISACKTYTSPKRCAHTEIPQRVCQTASAWPALGEINEVCNGLSKRGTRYLWRGNPTCLWGDTHSAHTRTHTLKHTHHGLPDQRIAGGVQMLPPLPEQQVDRHFFLWCLLSPCVLFRRSNMSWQSFLPEEKTDCGRNYDFCWVKCSCASVQLLHNFCFNFLGIPTNFI